MPAFIYNTAAFLANSQVQKDPGFIVGPIARVFGYIIDFIFNMVYAVSVNHSLGISIIFLTIIVRCLMLPMGVKQQQSMVKMQKLNPEIAKIRSKYGNSKDPEIQQKMNTEIQALYSKNKVNPLSGCLPILITMPLFFGLNYIIGQSFMYVTKLGALYEELAVRIIAVPHYTSYVVELALPHVPQNLRAGFDIGIPSYMAKVLSKFNANDWNSLFYQIEQNASNLLPAIKSVFEQKQAVETFFSLPLTEASGWGWPGILIPILTGLTTLFSSWLSNQLSAATADDKAKSTQRMMMIIMPIMMTVMTVGMSAGVGLYWITSSLFQTGQQVVLNRRSGIPLMNKKKT